MTLLAPSRTHLRTARGFALGWRAALLAALSIVAASSGHAQVVVGGNRPPSVAVDLTVLDRLGPAPTLPQLFGASRPTGISAPEPQRATPAPSETAPQRPAAKSSTPKKQPAAHRVVRHKPIAHGRLARTPAPRRGGAAPSRQDVHLVAPAAQPANATRLTPDRSVPAAPIRPASVALNPPAAAPMPALPQSTDAPTPPALPATPAHDEAPSPPLQPSQQAHDDRSPVPLTTQTAALDSQAIPTTSNTPTASSAPAPVQVAAAATIGSALNSVKFAPGLTDLPAGSQPVLDTVATKLLANDALRVQLIARASGGADQAMEARRVSLARAVAVRAYLIDKGVRSLRMDVRALGNRSDDGPATDQVDLLIVSQ